MAVSVAGCARMGRRSHGRYIAGAPSLRYPSRCGSRKKTTPPERDFCEECSRRALTGVGLQADLKGLYT